MKFVKFAAFALTFGLFVASCGENKPAEEGTTTDTTATTEMNATEPAMPSTDTTAMPATDTAAAHTDTAAHAGGH